DVTRRRAYQPTELLLLEDVGAPPGDPGAGEHRRKQVRRDFGEVEHHRGPELDVGGEDPVRPTVVQFLQRGLLQRLRHLVPRRSQLPGGAPQHPGTWVLGPVDAVAETHESLTTVEYLLDVLLRVAHLLDRFDHVQHAGRGPAVQRPGQRADAG